jgi:TonB dependent receptor
MAPAFRTRSQRLINARRRFPLKMSPYFGVSKSNLANFNSENTQNGIGAPESALQYEVGIKFSFLDDHVVLNTSAFDVSRNNVASAVTLNGHSGGGGLQPVCPFNRRLSRVAVGCLGDRAAARVARSRKAAKRHRDSRRYPSGRGARASCRRHTASRRVRRYGRQPQRSA